MAFKPIVLGDNFEAFEGGGRPYLPESDYLFASVKIGPSKEDYDGDPYWRWTFRIADGRSSVGRTWTEIMSFSEKSQTFVASTLKVLGIDPAKVKAQVSRIDSYAAFERLTEQISTMCAGRKLGVLIGDDMPRNGKPQSKIMERYSEAEYAERKAQAPVAAVAPTPPVAGGASVTNGKGIEDLMASTLAEFSADTGL